MKFNEKPKYSEEYSQLSNSIRVLASDSIERAKSGHPGMVLGMADVMTVLAVNFLKFNPNDPKWPDRDRLILSAGHGSMLLYSFYYLAGYKNFELADLQQFRKIHSKTPGHPEYGTYEAIEATTGPLGQGLAMSTGMAIAQKKYQQKLGKELSSHKIYCIIGDGCLMEGISYEAASLAGHLALNNLIVLFDNNQISIDGPTNLTVSEDHLAKFLSLGWNVESIDGHDFNQINAAFSRAQNSDKPYFIACNTVIAKGSVNKENSAVAHGSPLGVDEISLLKKNINFRDEPFFIPSHLKETWEKVWLRNKQAYDHWQKNGDKEKSYFDRPIIDYSFLDHIKAPFGEEATRVSSGRVIEQLVKASDKIILGSADLASSNNIKNSFSKAISKNDFNGNYIHYGVREHAMAAIMNGLALSGFLPIGGTFLVFSDYMRPSMRLSAIMQQQVIYVLTHDSIGVGEDGATHQPVEHLAGLRAMPNMLVLRPADYLETAESWRIALSNRTGPSVLALSRQPLPQIIKQPSSKGGYIVSPSEIPVDVRIFATGSELSIALKVKELLIKEGINVEVVSMLSFELFFKQDTKYVHAILSSAKLKVAIEASSQFGWHRIIGENGLFFGVDEYGLSSPSTELYEYFGLTAERITPVVMDRILDIYADKPIA